MNSTEQTTAGNAGDAITLTAPGREKDRRLIVIATLPGGRQHKKSFWIQDREERELYLDDLCATYRGIGPAERSELRQQLNAIARENRLDIEIHPPHGKVNGSARTSIDFYAGAQLVYNNSGNLFDSNVRTKWASDIADLVIQREGGRGKKERALKLVREINGRLLAEAQRVRTLPPMLTPAGGFSRENVPYTIDEQGINLLTKTREGADVVKPLTNFTARITGEITRNDGVEIEREFELEAVAGGRPYKFSVKASKFAEMAWPLEQLGASGLVYAGAGAKDHARAAIQMLSTDVKQRTLFTHTGWMQTPETGQWVYLHAGGVIGGGDVGVQLHPALSRFNLPQPPEGAALKAAIRSSLDMLTLAPATIIYPVYAAIWRAIIGGADMGVFVAGPSGTFKSELAALAQQHFGAGMDKFHLPANWSSTGNALEGMAFAAKDSLLTVDDFAPCGNISAVQQLHQIADRLFRAQGNNSGRQRSNADGAVRAPKPPRGMILATGEDIPRGQSLRARLMILEVSPGNITPAKLSKCQREAREGLYAGATAGFIAYLCDGNRIEKIRGELRERVAELRDKAVASDMHRRTPEVVANLAIGLMHALDFARHAQAISADEAETLWLVGWKAIGDAAGRQAAHQAVNEPATRFMQLVLSAINSGDAHIANGDGDAPDEERAAQCGWRRHSATSSTWEPKGARIGWIVDDQIYLDPDASYKAAQLAAGPGADGLVIQPNTLRLRLKEKGLLQGAEDGRTAIRKRIGKTLRMVLWLTCGALPLFYARTARTADPAEAETPFSSSPGGNQR